MMRYTAIHPDGRTVIAEVCEDQVRVTRQLRTDCSPECVEVEDKFGLEAQSIESAIEQWHGEGWQVSAEEIPNAEFKRAI
jgi:hypothetical protein